MVKIHIKPSNIITFLFIFILLLGIYHYTIPISSTLHSANHELYSNENSSYSLQIIHRYQVNGRVLNAYTSQPVAKVVIFATESAYNEQYQASTNTTGYYNLTLPQGSWNFTFVCNGYTSYSMNATISGNRTLNPIYLNPIVPPHTSHSSSGNFIVYEILIAVLVVAIIFGLFYFLYLRNRKVYRLPEHNRVILSNRQIANPTSSSNGKPSADAVEQQKSRDDTSPAETAKDADKGTAKKEPSQKKKVLLNKIDTDNNKRYSDEELSKLEAMLHDIHNTGDNKGQISISENKNGSAEHAAEANKIDTGQLEKKLAELNKGGDAGADGTTAQPVEQKITAGKIEDIHSENKKGDSVDEQINKALDHLDEHEDNSKMKGRKESKKHKRRR